MFTVNDLKQTARSRLADARVLHRAGQYDGAMYLCGYAVEISLKERICRTLRWTGFPETDAEFKNLSFLKVHNFDLLLKLTGREAVVKTRPSLMAAWSTVAQVWKPEARYRRTGTATEAQTSEMIGAAARLMRLL